MSPTENEEDVVQGLQYGGLLAILVLRLQLHRANDLLLPSLQGLV